MVYAAELASKLQLHNVIFYCDNSNVVNTLNVNSRDEVAHHLLEGSKERFLQYTRSMKGSKLMKLSRNNNISVHNLAKWARITNFQGEFDMSSLKERILSDEDEWLTAEPG